MIDFHKSTISGNEIEHILQAVKNGDLRGDGYYSLASQNWIEQSFGINRSLITPSCTAALELAALLLDISASDEVVLPSYTFPSNANAFLLRGANLKLIDIKPDTLNLNENHLYSIVSSRTKVICPVHYAGIVCEMDEIMKIASRNNIFVVEDAAHAIFSQYKQKYAGSIAHLGTFSFHETKNISCGEGGALLINSSDFIERAEILREKGTNRSKYFRGEIHKYSWVDIGSSYLASELVSAYLYAKLENSSESQKKRLEIWNMYYNGLEFLELRGIVKRPFVPSYCMHNAHIFYILTESEQIRDELLSYLNNKGIGSVFHYVPLHESAMGQKLGYKKGALPVSEDISRRILRLPLHNCLSSSDVNIVISEIINFYG